MNRLDQSVETIKGIGPKKLKLLGKLEIYRIRDLIYYFPKTYEDRRIRGTLRDASEGEVLGLKVKILERPSVQRLRGGMTVTKVLVTDGTEKAYLSWFNQNYMSNQFKAGEEMLVHGKVTVRGLIKEISSPVYTKDFEDRLTVGGVVPVYGLTKGITNNDVMKFVKSVLPLSEDIEDLPGYIKERYGLMSLPQSIRSLHFPEDRDDYLLARNSLAFDELMKLQLGLLLLKERRQVSKGAIAFKREDLTEEFKSGLPFELTGAQMSAIRDIQLDMESDIQMNRLVQGDVGSGKTIVGVFALLKAFRSGYQSAMMAPTEILAKQHHESLKGALEQYGLKVGLLVSNMKAKEKRNLIEEIKSGDIDVVVGTHALIEDYVEFEKLGLVITDEQHRFGVNQRARLSSKGDNPDVLIMTATPIPRTLALMIYGDLDITIIDEMPPGRKKIKTYGRSSSSRDKIYEFVRKQILTGRQAYVVCPLVEDSEKLDLKSSTSVYEELSEKFRDLRVGLLHGKMKAQEKDAVMEAFKSRSIDVLVSTTVIEVGVNVPNANVMVIENAERFGLSQLHQLRGRVGRGSYQSYCILINAGKGTVSKERIKTMEDTDDGFVISEKDLDLRGPGEFFGVRQHGIPELRIAKLPRDLKVLKDVQELSKELVETDPDLEMYENRRLKAKVDQLMRFDSRIEFN